MIRLVVHCVIVRVSMLDAVEGFEFGLFQRDVVETVLGLTLVVTHL